MKNFLEEKPNHKHEMVLGENPENELEENLLIRQQLLEEGTQLLDLHNKTTSEEERKKIFAKLMEIGEKMQLYRAKANLLLKN